MNGVIIAGIITFFVGFILVEFGVLRKGKNFLIDIEEEYDTGVNVESLSPEEVRKRIIERCFGIVENAWINSEQQIVVVGKCGTYVFSFDEGCWLTTDLPSYNFKISKIGRVLEMFKLVTKMKKANEIATIFKKLNGENYIGHDNENTIKSTSNKLIIGMFAAVLSIVLICGGLLMREGNISFNAEPVDSYIQTVQDAALWDTDYTYGEILNGFFENPTWEHFDSGNGEVIEFTGRCLYGEENVKVTFQYLVTKETTTTLEWELAYIGIDDEQQEFDLYLDIIEAAIEDYES